MGERTIDERITTRGILFICMATAACSSDGPAAPPPLRLLEGPGDVTFGCLEPASADGTGRLVAHPPSSCNGPSGRQLTAYILQPARGDVRVVANPGFGHFVDSDLFAPGSNGLAVGKKPVALTTSTEGCFAVTANAGSCDLSLVDVVKAVRADRGAVRGRSLSTVAGPLLARPTMVVARPAPPGATSTVCGEPSGHVYVAFAGCGLVARVDLASGAILDGVQALPGQPPALVGPNVTCPIECGAPAPARIAPSAMALEPDGRRLYAGVNGGALLVVDLEEDGRASAAALVPLEGAVGITRAAATGSVQMGNTAGVTFRFVYAIGTDGAIHVVDVTPARAPRECDTQINRGFLRDVTSLERLACFPVGDPNNPPRSAGAVGPGIRLPQGVSPLDVAFIIGDHELSPGAPASPQALFGLYALVTAKTSVVDARGAGFLYYVNVDDDNYPDLAVGETDVDIALAIPHALRVAGGGPFALPLTAAMPERIRIGPDNIAWVVDSGELANGLIRGQVLFVYQTVVESLRLR